VVERGTEGSFVIADVPGLIEGAAEGVGLGHRFLKHVQRTRLLLHLVAVLPEDAGDPIRRYEILRSELRRFDAALAKKPEIVVLTKIDACTDEAADEAERQLATRCGARVWRLSAVTGQGLKPLVDEIWRRLGEVGEEAV